MEYESKIRYGRAIFYSVFSFLIVSPELATVILPYIVFTDKKINLKLRIALVISTIAVLTTLFSLMSPFTYTIYRFYIMLVLLVVLMIFEELLLKWKKHWIIIASFLIIEFIVVTGFLSVLKSGVMW